MFKKKCFDNLLNTCDRVSHWLYISESFSQPNFSSRMSITSSVKPETKQMASSSNRKVCLCRDGLTAWRVPLLHQNFWTSCPQGPKTSRTQKMIWFLETSLVLFIAVFVSEQVSLRQSMLNDQISKELVFVFIAFVFISWLRNWLRRLNKFQFKYI